MTGAVTTGAFVMSGLGAYYLLSGEHTGPARLFVRLGVTVGLVASLCQLWPTGDAEGVQVADLQPAKLAAMEGLFRTSQSVGIVLIGQPNVQTQTIDNAIEVPSVLSFLTYRAWTAEVKGLDAFPRDQWPDAIALLYYAYHIMVGLGTLFILAMLIAGFWLWRGRLWTAHWALWMLLLATPFPFLANTAGWMTTELGRQPWLVYALIRTADGTSPLVSSANILFTTLGFAGMYTIMSLLYVVVLVKEVGHGPDPEPTPIAMAADEVMESLWFALVAVMLAMYVLLDGFDLGAGAIYFSVARTDLERRLVLRSIGPVWDGNEVWLLAAGGTLFFTFPRLYAAGFSGFYLPLMIVLWLLMLRGLALELRSHMQNNVWSGLWDGLFCLGSTLLAIFYGAALGNVVRGVPLNAQGYFFEPLWTDFNPSSAAPGVLDWYTVLVGLLALAALALHGAHYIAVKTEDLVNSRCRRLARRAWVATTVLTLLTTVATFAIKPTMLTGFVARPWGVVFPLLAVGGLAAIRWTHVHQHDGRSLIASGAYLAGMLTSAAFTLYPAVLPAILPGLQPDDRQRRCPDVWARRRSGVVGPGHGPRGGLLRHDLSPVSRQSPPYRWRCQLLTDLPARGEIEAAS